MIMMKDIWKSNLIQVTIYLLNKISKIIMTIIVRAVFHENNKYYPQVFLGESLYKI